VNDSDPAIGYGGGLSGWAQEADIGDTLHLRNVAIATTFWLSTYGCTLAPPGEYD